MDYILMHRDIKTARIGLDLLSGLASVGTVYNEAHLPFGTLKKYGVDKIALAQWWASRSIPASRSGLREVLEQLHFSVPQELLDKCYGLSLSDQYWICPVGSDLNWDDINFFDNLFSEDIGNLLFGHEKKDEIDLISPDNTSDGQQKKKWKIINGKRVLIKGASKPFCQEPLNEVIASLIADRLGFQHVAYSLLKEDEGLFSICDDFVTKRTELVSAWHVMQAFKKPNAVSDYEFYIRCCMELGVDDIRDKLEEMILLDYIIANEDRHLNNFGLLRDAVSLEWLTTAPLFDCGTSLWYNTVEIRIDPTDPDLPCKPFRKTHDEQIRLIRDVSRFDMTGLDGIETEVMEILTSSPDISESRAEILCNALRTRISGVRALQ